VFIEIKTFLSYPPSNGLPWLEAPKPLALLHCLRQATQAFISRYAGEELNIWFPPEQPGNKHSKDME
jgi:hypothetical protein